ncbi:MAG: YadA C-terminal domain-containing protein, partial [Glaciimonas sp.]|nr:YadA C-terminal domain-containing protein [Glaciimonas sp.]
PTDAVNKRQLDGAIAGVNNRIGDVARSAYSGIAAATALTMIPDVDPGRNFSFGIAAAQYQGYAATAVGFSARIKDRVKLKAGAGISNGGNTIGAGASYQW